MKDNFARMVFKKISDCFQSRDKIEEIRRGNWAIMTTVKRNHLEIQNELRPLMEELLKEHGEFIDLIEQALKAIHDKTYIYSVHYGRIEEKMKDMDKAKKKLLLAVDRV